MALKQLAVLDVEGIIIPKRRYLLLQATKELDIRKIFTLLLYGFLYEIGAFTLEIALKRIYRLFQGVSRDELHRTFNTIPIIPGVQYVLETLKTKRYNIAFISSGIPDFLVEELAQQLGADHAHGINLETRNNRLTGKICGDVLKTNGKAIILERILKTHNYSRHHCLVIADDRNNLPMFSIATKTIGYNPDSLLAVKCDHVIKGRLKDILPFLETPTIVRTIPYTRNDACRDVIHMGSCLIPICCQFFNLSRYSIATVILTITIVFAFSELARRSGVNLPPFTTITNIAAVGEERWSFATAPIFFALGIVLALTLYPPQIGFAAITILTLGDGTARIVGKKLGRIVIPYNKAKKFEGTVGGILVSTLITLLYVSPFKALIASIISMTVESLPLPISDNIVIPIVAGLILAAIQ